METRRTQAHRSQSAKEQIVQAALTVFALKGYAASSMDDVCLAAGCSKGGLYHHFATKSAVLSGVVDKLALSGALAPPFTSRNGELALQPAAIGRILIEVWAEASRDLALRAQLHERYQASLEASVRESASIIDILRIGAVIQLLTRGGVVDADEAARRLGIESAA